MKKQHDNQPRRNEFQVGEKVLLFNTRLKIYPRKLASRWIGPYKVIKVTPYRAIGCTPVRE